MPLHRTVLKPENFGAVLCCLKTGRDEDRRTNAQRFEEEFYSGKSPSSARSSADTDAAGDAATLMKLLTNPETASLLKALVNAMGNEESK